MKELDTINDNISELCAEKNRKKINALFSDESDPFEANKTLKTWKLRKKLAPSKICEPPTAKKDDTGMLVTDKVNLEKLYIDCYKERMKPNKMKDNLINMEAHKENLFRLRLKLASQRRGADWTIYDLDKVLKTLKNKKARDSLGHTYELFKFGGIQLKFSLLRMFNNIKNQQIYPKIFKLANITSIYKGKGEKK